MKALCRLAVATAAVGLISAGIANAQEQRIRHSIVDHMADMSPGIFYLDTDQEKELVHFSSNRDLQICVGQERHTTAVKLTYDGKTAMVAPGDCFQFDAKEVAVTPASDLPSGVDLKGEITVFR